MKNSKGLLKVACIVLLAAFTSVPAGAQQVPTELQRETIENIVKELLLKNPEIVVEAIQNYQNQQREKQLAEQSRRIDQLRDELERSVTSPVGGNPDGDVVLVEFFDYRCGYCKRVHDTVLETVKTDGNVRLVYKEYPILGPESLFASSAALGVFFEMPEKYKAFNDALMRTRGSLTKQRVLQIAAELGLDPTLVEKSANSAKVGEELQRTKELARQLSINGTPAFVIGNTVVPGAMDADAMRRVISEARQG